MTVELSNDVGPSGITIGYERFGDPSVPST